MHIWLQSCSCVQRNVHHMLSIQRQSLNFCCRTRTISYFRNGSQCMQTSIFSKKYSVKVFAVKSICSKSIQYKSICSKNQGSHGPRQKGQTMNEKKNELSFYYISFIVDNKTINNISANQFFLGDQVPIPIPTCLSMENIKVFCNFRSFTSAAPLPCLPHRSIQITFTRMTQYVQ